MNDFFMKDYERFTPNKYRFLPSLLRRIKNHELEYIYLGRLGQTTKNPLLLKYSKFRLHFFRRKYGLELNFTNIGSGIRLVLPWMITVNANSILGENVTLYKGVTIGEIDLGSRKGVPTIGNNVTVYPNATICGGIHIGDNCVIASNSFVNVDVPDNSFVIGNPATIHQK